MKLGKIHLEFLILFTSVVLVGSCHMNSKSYNDNDLLQEYMAEKFNINVYDYDIICTISENGCTSCNSAYVRKLNSIINRDNILFLITTKGTYFDISYFTKTERKNVVFDFNPPKNIEILTNSTFIHLDKGAIIKAINVNPENLDLIQLTIDNL